MASNSTINPTNTIAVVVWFQPSTPQVQNILSYLSYVRHVIIVDNSSQDNSTLLAHLPATSYSYLPLYDNYGIATALNKGCRLAVSKQAEWILTMDQDSTWEEQQLIRYLHMANIYPQIQAVGVFSPRQDYNGHTHHYAQEYEQKTAVMTSGCLIAAKGFQETNGFREDFFIDEVDNEYCMHIRQLGMQVVIINNTLLQHHLGDQQHIHFLGFLPKQYASHAPWRYYYMVRNNLSLSDSYPQYRGFNNKRLHRTIKRVVLYHRSHKLSALRMCLRGWWDYRHGRMGRRF